MEGSLRSMAALNQNYQPLWTNRRVEMLETSYLNLLITFRLVLEEIDQAEIASKMRKEYYEFWLLIFKPNFAII